MAFFLPSFFQKRILRYALARLELFNTDELDLEKLDITWGKTSTIELRDIGINLEKISALLKLPQAFSITKAQISSLRLTVPANLYQGNIIVEADGVDVTIRTDATSANDETESNDEPSYRASDKNPKNVKTGTSKNTSSHEHHRATSPSFSEAGGDGDAHLPTTLDLAQSFMLSEPTEQRSELQAAVTQSLQMSQSLSPTENDLDASEVGMGNDVSLPGFLASYLKGVGDRVKLNMKNINLDLILRLANKAELHSTEEVRIRIAMSRIAIGEVSGELAEKQTRRVEGKLIQLIIISEQSLFSNLAKSTSFSSPETSRASAILANEDSSQKSTSYSAHTSSPVDIEDNRSFQITDYKTSQSSILHNKSTASEGLNEYKTTGVNPSVEDIAADQDLDTSGTGSDLFHSMKENNNILNTVQSSPAQLVEDPNSTSTSAFSSSEDLTESKIFSHDQRESMYLSVMSDLPPTSDDDHDLLVPGAWKSSYMEDDLSLGVSKERMETDEMVKAQGKAEKSTPNNGRQDTVTDGYRADDGEMLIMPPGSEKTAHRISLASLGPRQVPESPVSDDLGPSSRSSRPTASNLRDANLMAKRLISIDSIILELPCGDPGTADRSPVSNDNHSQSETSRPQHAPQTFSELPHNSAKEYAAAKSSQYDSSQLATVIALRNVQIASDVGLTKLIISVVEKLCTICQPLITKQPKQTPSPSKAPSRYVVAANTISWKFVDLVRAISVADMTTSQIMSSYPVLHDGADILLSTQITRLHLEQFQLKDHSRTKVLIKDFSIGYADAAILSFESGTKTGKSPQDTSMLQDGDMRLDIVQTKDILSVDVNTLPMHLVLDLRRLDETFSWFGGFSSMLSLGNSMISTVTLLDPNAKALPARNTSRTVHFDSRAPESTQRKGVPAQSKKITARIGGFVFDLQGVDSGLRVESTAMKIVSRPEGLGGQIDRLKLSGPVVGSLYDHPPVLAKLANLRIEYLFIPKENDLSRLLSLLSPSKDTYGDEDDILVDTLIRQRKKGSVLRMTIENFDVHLSDATALRRFPLLIEEAKKLSTVAKYLPEDDRPGILTLFLIKSVNAEAHVDEKFGVINLKARNVEVANITFPSLSALGILDIHLYRNSGEELLGPALQADTRPGNLEPHPMIMSRFVGNEMEPTVKINVINARLEYYVTAIMSLMDLRADLAAGELVSDMINSVRDLAIPEDPNSTPSRLPSKLSGKKDNLLTEPRGLKFDVTFRDVVLGLNPLGSVIKGLIAFTDAHFLGSMPTEGHMNSTLEVRKAELMIIDDVTRLLDPNASNQRKGFDTANALVRALSEIGYISISQISAMKVALQVVQSRPDPESMIEAEISNYLFVLESCADSTQTVITLLKGLSLPTPKSTALKYQTEVVPVEDMLASFSGEVFAIDRSNLANKGQRADDDDDGDSTGDDDSENLDFVGSFYDTDLEKSYSESLEDSTRDEDADSLIATSVFDDSGEPKLSDSRLEGLRTASGPQSLDIRENHFDLDSSIDEPTNRLEPRLNKPSSSKGKHQRSPLRVRMRDVHIIWNMFDGYDWQHTRDAISQAVAEVQTKAIERQSAYKRQSAEPEEEDEDVIGDFLFNSIYIGIPAKSDPTELALHINHNIDDLASDAGSFSTLKSGKDSPIRAQPTRLKSKQQLRLRRSKHHKMTFELKGVSLNFIVAPPRSGELESTLDIRVQDLEIFDHVPTSTWKKFATYMHDAGERESDASMIHIEILNVKPVPDLAASEIMLKATILPLRLHVDQDALDFMTRFFAFKDESSSELPPSQADAPFIQRAEIKSIRVRLDFKPKRVDYIGLRSGRTTEFMNFMVLDSADMVLRHSIVYGVSGFDRLGKTLNDIWMPDIKRNQLPGVLAGLAPVRSLVNVGGGMRDLFIVPIREYKKDGRVVRSFQKGALAFAKTTTSELMRLGAKLAIGTQTILHGAEDILNQSNQNQDRLDIAADWDESDLDENEKKQISHYADQPIGVIQGLRGAYASLERDLLTARDAVVAMPGEIMESGTAGGAAQAVLRRAPTVILRPAMGVSAAVGQTLMGATNSLDPSNRRRIEDKYKKY